MSQNIRVIRAEKKDEAKKLGSTLELQPRIACHHLFSRATQRKLQHKMLHIPPSTEDGAQKAPECCISLHFFMLPGF
jgi:hypothetical protein